jgi:hypothetical protein
MAPFIPPPSREAPYRALPPHVFTWRFKLWRCFLSYLQWQIMGLVFAPMVFGFSFLAHHEAYFQSARYRGAVWIFSGMPIFVGGLFGVIAALWRFAVIQINEHQNKPPAKISN